MKRTILITGGAGFIGSNFVLEWAKHVSCDIVNLDKLTYAGNLQNLHLMFGRAGYHFVHGDICDRELVRDVLHRSSTFCSCALRRGEPCGSLDPWARRVYPY